MPKSLDNFFSFLKAFLVTKILINEPRFNEFPWLFVKKQAYKEGAVFAIKPAMKQDPRLKITLPNLADHGLIDGVF